MNTRVSWLVFRLAFVVASLLMWIGLLGLWLKTQPISTGPGLFPSLSPTIVSILSVPIVLAIGITALVASLPIASDRLGLFGFFGGVMVIGLSFYSVFVAPADVPAAPVEGLSPVAIYLSGLWAGALISIGAGLYSYRRWIHGLRGPGIIRDRLRGQAEGPRATESQRG